MPGVLEAAHLDHFAAEIAEQIDIVSGRRVQQRTGDSLFSQPLPNVQVAGNVMKVIRLRQGDLAELALLLQPPRIGPADSTADDSPWPHFTPDFPIAATIRRQLSRAMAMGFSRYTCFDASAAAMVCSACSLLGEAMTTASTSACRSNSW